MASRKRTKTTQKAATPTAAALSASAPTPDADPVRRPFDRRLAAIALALVLAVFAIYGQTRHHEFIAFDDDTYIFDNHAVINGFSTEGFFWAFGFRAGNWHPLTWFSHMLDAQLFGRWAGGHHLVNAGIHAANAVLLAALLAKMTGALWRAGAVAALFALHPLRVESVAWASERKDVLAALFWLLATAAYLRYARRPGTGRYLTVLGLFALGLTAKPMIVTLPFTLLLLDIWPLGRAPLPWTGSSSRRAFPGSRSWPALVAEKAPFLALSLISSLVTMRGQTENVLPFVTPAFPTRAANAAVSYLLYLRSFLWPSDLAFLYPYPSAGIPWPAAATALAALVGISVAVLVFGARRPYLPVGWLWYLGTLVPVIGLVQVGGQARGDRYTYVTMVGVALALVWLVDDLWLSRARARRALAGATAGALVTLAFASGAYARVWRDSITLFEHTVRVTRDNFIILNNLGSMLLTEGRPGEAIEVLRETERINPGHCNAPYNLGVTLIRLIRHQEALPPLARALACYQREGRAGIFVADTHYNLGLALSRTGRYTDAEGHFRAALSIAPGYPGARKELAEVLVRQGKGLTVLP